MGRERTVNLSSRIARNVGRKLGIENTIDLDHFQKVFIRRDGITENICLLQNIIYQHTKNLNPLQICLMDVFKVFDSVSYDDIIANMNTQLRNIALQLTTV